VKMRVRPYYLYQCDLVAGSGHFRTTIAAGLEIMEALRGHTSGYAIPTYAVDLPGGGGKVPVTPNYLISQAPGRVVFRNFEGYITTYTEPTDYQRPKRTRWTAEPRPEPGQRGIAGLLAGEGMAIQPAGWETRHHDQPSAAPDENLEMDALAALLNRPDVQVADGGDAPTWMKIH